MNRNTNLAKVRNNQEEWNNHMPHHDATQVSTGDGRGHRNRRDQKPHVSIVDNRRVQNITINHNYQPPPNQQAYRQTHPQLGSGKRDVSFLLGVGIFFLPIIFAWFTLRDGHSTVSRVVSFIWLAFVVLSTCVGDRHDDTSRRVDSGYETGVRVC